MYYLSINLENINLKRRKIMKHSKDEIKAKIQKWQDRLDNFQEELEVGKWYIENGSYRIVCYSGTSSNTDIVCGYGFGCCGWNNDKEITYGNKKYWDLATDQEVETALIKEAKKKGFKSGANFKSLGRVWLSYSTAYFTFYDDKLTCPDGIIFADGKWAEIIEDKKPKINGFEMEDLGKDVKFGCKTFNKDSLNRLYVTLSEFDIDRFDLEGYTITVEQLKDVVDYLNK